MPARRDDDEACSQNQNAASRRPTRRPPVVSSRPPGKTGFWSWARIPLLNKRHTLPLTALEPQTLPVGPVLLHEPVDVVLRQYTRLPPPADVRGGTHGLDVPVGAANVDDRFDLRRGLDVVFYLRSLTTIFLIRLKRRNWLLRG